MLVDTTIHDHTDGPSQSDIRFRHSDRADTHRTPQAGQDGTCAR